MNVFEMKKLAGHAKLLTGATLARKHLDAIITRIPSRPDEGDHIILLLDFQGVEFVSASYLKGTAITLAKEHSSDIALFPVVHNLSVEMREELWVACEAERFPCLEVLRLTQEDLISGRMYGDIDNAFKRSLQLLEKTTPATAADLAERSKNEQINLTAWNNRLAELFRLRLATRTKEGRFWKYQPVIKEITYG